MLFLATVIVVSMKMLMLSFLDLYLWNLYIITVCIFGGNGELFLCLFSKLEPVVRSAEPNIKNLQTRILTLVRTVTILL